MVSEIADLERVTLDRDAKIGEKLFVNRRRMIHMSLKLAAAMSKSRVMATKAADAEVRLFAAEQEAEMSRIKAHDAEARASLLQAHALEKEQEAVLAQDTIAKLERKAALDGHRLTELANNANRNSDEVQKMLRSSIEKLEIEAAEAKAQSTAQLRHAQAETDALRQQMATEMVAANEELVEVQQEGGDDAVRMQVAAHKAINTRDAALSLLSKLLSWLQVPVDYADSDALSTPLGDGQTLDARLFLVSGRVDSDGEGQGSSGKARLRDMFDRGMDQISQTAPQQGAGNSRAPDAPKGSRVGRRGSLIRSSGRRMSTVAAAAVANAGEKDRPGAGGGMRSSGGAKGGGAKGGGNLRSSSIGEADDVALRRLLTDSLSPAELALHAVLSSAITAKALTKKVETAMTQTGMPSELTAAAQELAGELNAAALDQASESPSSSPAAAANLRRQLQRLRELQLDSQRKLDEIGEQLGGSQQQLMELTSALAAKEALLAERDAQLVAADAAVAEAEARIIAKSRQLRGVAYHLSCFLGGTPLAEVRLRFKLRLRVKLRRRVRVLGSPSGLVSVLGTGLGWVSFFGGTPRSPSTHSPALTPHQVGVADERLDEAATVAKGLADAIRPPVYLVAPSSIMADEKLDQTKPWHPSLPAADSEGGAGGKAADAEAATGPRRSRAEPGAYPRSSGGESGGELVRLLRDEDTSSEAGGALKPGGLAPVAADSTKVIGAGSANSQRPGCGQPLRPITSHEGSLRGSP